MKRPHPNPGVAYQAALDAMQRADAKLARAFNAWQKARLRLRMAEKTLDRAMAAQEPAGPP